MVSYPRTNFVRGTPTRKRRRVGECFEVNLLDRYWVMGRVIALDANWALIPGVGALLLHFYADVRKGPIDAVPEFIEPKLLIEPVMTNNLGWGRGYFRTVETRPILPGESFDVHCFEDQWFVKDRFVAGHPKAKYYDHSGKRLRGRSEPCGVLELHSYLTIDQCLSAALGLEVIED